MNRAHLLLSAYGFDVLAGDPEWFPHPVRIMGAAITRGEALLRAPHRSTRADFLSGALLTVSIVVGSYLASDFLVKRARKRSPALGNVVEVLLAWTSIAARSLHDEASSVLAALDAKHLASARYRLSRIVGRDTLELDESEICRAVIETVAESLSDGVLAPFFYLTIGGVPLAFAYKAVNTLDSMIGHADERYFYFGKFAARLDDVANLFPARVTAIAIISAAGLLPDCDAAASLSVWRADHAAHKSPNAGHPESAMAGALGARLGGDNYYAGEHVRAPYLGHQFPRPLLRSAGDSLKVATLATALGVTFFAFLSAGFAKGAQR